MDMYREVKNLKERMDNFEGGAVEAQSTPSEARRRAIKVLEDIGERMYQLEMRLDEMHLEVERMVEQQQDESPTIELSVNEEVEIVGNRGPIPGTMTTHSDQE